MDLLYQGLRYIETMMRDNPEIPGISWCFLTFIGVIIWYFVFGRDADKRIRLRRKRNARNL